MVEHCPKNLASEEKASTNPSIVKDFLLLVPCPSYNGYSLKVVS